MIAAIHSWQIAGFDIVGRMRRAFLRPMQRHDAALVMFHDLTEGKTHDSGL